MNNRYKSISRVIQIFIVLILITLTVTGSDCEKVLVNQNTIPQELIGDWQLKEQTGAQQDICPQEVVTFQSTGIAKLTCPGSDQIARDFTLENNILSYTQTSISYDAEFSDDNLNLSLYGRNVSRNLFYQKIVTADIQNDNNKKTDFINSSDLAK
jgi:hypothetical protein